MKYSYYKKKKQIVYLVGFFVCILFHFSIGVNIYYIIMNKKTHTYYDRQCRIHLRTIQSAVKHKCNVREVVVYYAVAHGYDELFF